MQFGQRQDRYMKKFAPIIGGIDTQGVRHQIPDDSRLKQHLFYLKNLDMENASGEFMLGHVIRGKVIDGIYEIEYLGLNKHSKRPKEGQLITKEHQKVIDRIDLLGERQRKEIAQAKMNHLETLGIFVDEDEAMTPSI